MTIEGLSDVDESELQMALAEWKRWRNRVRHAETMNRRQERYAQACAQIDAIEEEMEFRRTCRQRHQAALVQANRIAAADLVSLNEFRTARTDADTIAQRMRQLK
jgi:hypothetical protein